MSEGVAARLCGWCGAALPEDGSGRLYCNESHSTRAKRKRNGRSNRTRRQQAARREEMRERSRERDASRRSCEDKTPYCTAAAAVRVIQRRGGVGNIYECGDHWHITRRPVNAPAKWRSAFAPAGRSSEEER